MIFRVVAAYRRRAGREDDGQEANRTSFPSTTTRLPRDHPNPIDKPPLQPFVRLSVHSPMHTTSLSPVIPRSDKPGHSDSPFSSC